MTNFFNLTPLDWFALAMFLTVNAYFSWRIEREIASPPSTYALMVSYRSRWMDVLIDRPNRIVDAQILGMLQQSARFFSSGMMIAIGAVIALMSRPDLQTDLEGVFHLNIEQSAWNLKLFFTGLVLANGFFKFLWSGRVFGYNAIVMAAIPEDKSEAALREANRASKLNIAASKSFNRGLRMIYFALASLCWLLGAVPFIIATVLIAAIIWRREFHSHTRSALMEEL